MLAHRIIVPLGSALIVAALGCGGGGGGGSGTGPAAVFTSVQLTPASPTISVSGTVTMTAVPLDQNGAFVGGATAASFTTSDASKATVNAITGVVTGVAVGSPSITASITSAGITKTAAQTVTVSAITNNITITGTATNTWSPQNAQVASVATVQWVLSGNHSVVFDTGPGTLPADVAQTATGVAAQRTLTAPGTYAYHCGVHGTTMSGTVVVH